ncbi:hypothetical protein COLO4_02448, partial [Corchorus olitorius]
FAQNHLAARGSGELAQPGAGLFVGAGLPEVAGFGHGDQRVVRLGDIAGTGDLLFEHRRQDPLPGRFRVLAVIDIGRGRGQGSQRGLTGAEQQSGEKQPGMLHGGVPSHAGTGNLRTDCQRLRGTSSHVAQPVRRHRRSGGGGTFR